MQRQGVVVIVSVVSLGLAAASWGWWVRYDASDSTMQYFSPAVARRILQAPEVRLYRLSLEPDASLDVGEPDDANEPGEALAAASELAPDGRCYRIVERYSMADWQGMSHLRHAFVQDSSYRWPPLAANPESLDDWQWLFVFQEEEEQTKLWLRLANGESEPAILQADSATHALNVSPAASGIREVLRAGLDAEATN